MNCIESLSRRDVLRLAGVSGAGLAIGVFPESSAAAPALQPSAFLRIDSSGNVTLWIPRTEVGQGATTALAQAVADELEADWRLVRVANTDFDPKLGKQDTGGSESVRSLLEPMRRAGAAAREMLIEAGAQALSVPKPACRATSGKVVHSATRKSVPYGAIVARAAKLRPPENPSLKPASARKLLGKPTVRLDSKAKITGAAVFPIDVRLPGMLYAAVARCPSPGGSLERFDPAGALKVDGVKRVLQIPSGVAVLASNTYAAFQGRDALKIFWKEGPEPRLNSNAIRTRMEALSTEPGKSVRSTGGPVAASGKRIEAVYESPFQAHAPMEPLSCTARIAGGRCEVWAAAQAPSWAMQEARRVTGMPDSSIRLHIVPSGGAFGRGITPEFIAEAVELAKAAGVPVKVQRAREDDIQRDLFRPPAMHRLSAAMGADGLPFHWRHRIVSASIARWLDPNSAAPERGETGGAVDLPYAIPHVDVEYKPLDLPVPRGWWRSVEHATNAWAVECFLDELAAEAQSDPLKYRLKLLGDVNRDAPQGMALPVASRLRAVLETAVRKAGWGRSMPARSGMGLACHHSFGTYVATVATVSVDAEGNWRTTEVVCAVDCGQVVNPLGAEAQVEGSVVFGLSAMRHAITLEQGKIKESNFHNYPMLKIDECPRIEAVFVNTGETPGGLGEPVVPTIAPAVCNALFAATGKRIRRLPARSRDLRV